MVNRFTAFRGHGKTTVAIIEIADLGIVDKILIEGAVVGSSGTIRSGGTFARAESIARTKDLERRSVVLGIGMAVLVVDGKTVSGIAEEVHLVGVTKRGDQAVGEAVVVISPAGLNMRIGTVDAEIDLAAESVIAPVVIVAPKLRCSRIERDAIERDAKGHPSRVPRPGSELGADWKSELIILHGDAMGVPAIGELAGIVIGDTVGGDVAVGGAFGDGDLRREGELGIGNRGWGSEELRSARLGNDKECHAEEDHGDGCDREGTDAGKHAESLELRP